MTSNDHIPEEIRPEPPRTLGKRAQIRRVLSGVATLVVFGALGVMVAGTVSTAQSRFSGSTTNEGSIITTGAIDIVVERDTPSASTGSETRFDLLFDVEMVAGQTETRCVELTYRGTVDDVVVGLYGAVGEGDGLDAFLETSVRLGSGVNAGCADFVSSTIAFEGTLRQLVAAHDSLPNSIPLLVSPQNGESVTVQVAVTLSNENEAQGLSTGFFLSLEART